MPSAWQECLLELIPVRIDIGCIQSISGANESGYRQSTRPISGNVAHQPTQDDRLGSTSIGYCSNQHSTVDNGNIGGDIMIEFAPEEITLMLEIINSSSFAGTIVEKVVSIKMKLLAKQSLEKTAVKER